MTTETLILCQSSMQHTDGTRAKQTDIEGAIPDGKRKTSPDAIGFTELDRDLIRIIKDRCEAMGYHFGRLGTVGLAVNSRCRIKTTAGVDVLPGLKTVKGKGNHSSRGILETTFVTPGDNEVTVHVAHWITDSDTERRDDKREQQSDAMVERVRLHGQGKALSFWMGDTNDDERKPKGDVQKVLTRGHLVSIYDALDKYPSTHGKKTLDVIGHFDADGRVKPEKVVVGKVRGSDHKKVTATYTIGGGPKR